MLANMMMAVNLSKDNHHSSSHHDEEEKHSPYHNTPYSYHKNGSPNLSEKTQVSLIN